MELISWSKVLSIIGMVLGAILLLALIIMCIVFPIIRVMVSRATKAFMGQFPVVQTSVTMADTQPLNEDDNGSQYVVSEML